nr:DUF885 family protein [Sphingomonas sp. Y38-1Y]
MAVAPLAAQTAAATPDPRLKALYDAEWAFRSREFADLADAKPGEPSADDHLPSVTPAAYQRRLAYWKDMLAKVDAIPVAGLSDEDRMNHAVFRTYLWEQVNNIEYRTYEAPFNSDSFFWTGLSPRRPYARTIDYRRYLGRMRDVPRYFDEQIANMRAGLSRGYSVPSVTTTGRDKTIEPFAAAGETNPFFKPFAEMPASIPLAERTALQAEARQVIATTLAPAYAKLLAFMRTEYLPKTRRTIDAQSLPDGRRFYQDRIREYTTLDLTPDQIHQIGLKEVARIDADMQATMKETGFNGSFPEFLKFMRTDPRFYARTPKELLSLSAYVVKKMDGKLKDNFATLPRYRFTILPVPDEIAPIYTSGRGGLDACLMNTYDLAQRPLYNIPALTLHECNPGHSFQAAVALEAPERPRFRQETYFSGYGEGWGLYTEWLGKELGIYEGPYEEFGRQTFEMWRAARLVVDTGIHAKGWTRSQAIDYFTQHTALAPLDIANEVDRYISWPGQALAYKLGELSIRRMRAKAEKALGDRFDIRRFHDTVLGMGSVPLSTFEDEIDRFIARERALPPER